MGDIIVGGLESTSSLETKLQSLFTKKQPSALGMATAFLSLAGAQKFDSLVMNSGATAIRVVIASQAQ